MQSRHHKRPERERRLVEYAPLPRAVEQIPYRHWLGNTVSGKLDFVSLELAVLDILLGPPYPSLLEIDYARLVPFPGRVHQLEIHLLQLDGEMPRTARGELHVVERLLMEIPSQFRT